MAANLTPQYLKAEEQYRRAASAEEELRWLEVMLRELPKHKASEKMQCDLKTKISRTRKTLEGQRKAAAKPSGVQIDRQGAGRVVLLGGPNAGKSRLLAALTRATPEVAPYPFTTRVPQPGMMPWEDVMVQLIDTPPITPDVFDAGLHGLIRGADLVLLLLDLGSDDGPEQCQAVLDALGQTKSRLARTSYLDEEDMGLSFTQALLVPNKIDLPEAAERLELFHELYSCDLPALVISAEQGTGLPELKAAAYRALDVIRVYTKNPKSREPDYDRPFTLRRGGTVRDVAELIHKDLAEQLKHARIWGEGIHDGSTVKGDHVLADRNVIELHV